MDKCDKETCKSARFNALMAILVLLICIFGAWPIMVKAEEQNVLRTGDIRTGEFPICEDLDNAVKMATLLADEGEEKAAEFQQDPKTPCGSTVMGTPWMIGEVRYVLQANDKQWVRVVELHAPPHVGITRYWVTRVEVKRAAPPKGKSV